jgi:hypothetical protein
VGLTRVTTGAGRTRQPLGVYGFALHGIEPPPHLLVPVDESAPPLGVFRVPDGQLPPSATELRGPLLGGGEVGMDVAHGNAYYAMPRWVPDDEMLHPWLAPAAFWRAHHVGRLVIHGGLVAAGGRAVAVVGEREAGKSSLTASIAFCGRELDVLTDDVIVVDGDRVFAGPRCIDLRPSALGFFGERLPMRPARDNTRYRVELPPCPPDATLTGIVVLRWSDAFEMRPVAPPMRLPTLLQHLAVVDTGRPTAHRLLDLAALPMWLFERPKDARLLDRSVDEVARILDKSAA